MDLPDTVNEERIEGLLTALALASVGSFEEAGAKLAAPAHDSLGALEEALFMFIGRLASATRQSARALADLEAERRDVEAKLETIQRQQATIRELLVPVIDVWDEVVTLPIVGLLDTSRAAHVTERLLRRVSQGDVKWVILDLTGVMVVDVQTAQHLIRLSRAVDLLGAQCILTGIGADLASAITSAGVELHGLTALRSLKDGLAFCMNRQSSTRGWRRRA